MDYQSVPLKKVGSIRGRCVMSESVPLKELIAWARRKIDACSKSENWDPPESVQHFTSEEVAELVDRLEASMAPHPHGENQGVGRSAGPVSTGVFHFPAIAWKPIRTASRKAAATDRNHFGAGPSQTMPCSPASRYQQSHSDTTPQISRLERKIAQGDGTSLPSAALGDVSQ